MAGSGDEAEVLRAQCLRAYESILPELSLDTLARVWDHVLAEATPAERAAIDARAPAGERSVVPVRNPWRPRHVEVLDEHALDIVCKALSWEDRACARLVCRSMRRACADADAEEPAVKRLGSSRSRAVLSVRPEVLFNSRARIAWALDQPGFRVGRLCRKTACQTAAAAGDVGALQWAHALSCELNEGTCATAALRGHLAVLRWARGRGCPWDEKTCACAALGGHLDALQWARAHGCPWDAMTACNAATGGHLEVLQWARANKCPWDGRVGTCAASGGHLPVLAWAEANRCPLELEACARATPARHAPVAEWLRQRQQAQLLGHP